MLAELHRCPSLFHTTNSQWSVMVKINESAERLGVFVATGDGDCYKDEFDEVSLLKAKTFLGEQASWAYFFNVMQEAFDHANVTVKAATDTAVEVLCHAASGDPEKCVICLKVGKTDEDLLPVIVKSLLDVYHIQLYSREKERQVEEVTAEATQARMQVEHLEKEIRVLKESNVRKKKQDVYNIQRIEELRAKIAEAEEEAWRASSTKEHVKTHSKSDHSKTVPVRKGRIRQPLGDAECKQYEVELLRLIKSRWCTDDNTDPNAVYNCVIVPFTPAELSQRTRNFTNKKWEVVWKSLDRLDEWDYNVFEIQTAMCGDDYSSLQNQPNGGSLFVTMYALLIKYAFLVKFNIDEQVALNWISNVEAGYHGNPYHNSMHAADVLHITHYILNKGGMINRCQLSDRQVFAALFAAAIHDYNHPGVNNNFHIKTQSHGATLYNDRSVLENMHIASVFELMKNPNFNILSSFSEEHRREIRDTIIEMVLATDMGLHGKYVAQFKRRLGEHAAFTDRDDQNLALAIALKMADISNCGRPLDIYLRWSSKVSDEFYMQGDRERNIGMPCSPFMNRLEPALAKGQISFMNYIIVPFFEMVAELVPNMRFAVECAESCKAYWMQPGRE